MIRKLATSSHGKLSLDLLVGLSIFLMAFLVVSQLIAGMFGEVRSEISLSHEAYKVSVILAEMPGKWSNGTKNGTDWENNWFRPNTIFLPGLAVKSCELSYEKIVEFRNATQSDYEKVKQLLGLKTPDSNYEFHISLETLNSTPFKRELLLETSGTPSGTPLLDVGMDIPETQMARFERIVWIDNSSVLVNPTIVSGRAVAKLVVVVW
ncbi:hypothetical protein GAH_01495 [Geoglobus ahangari]|uniref:Uncharacterized protein n=1 Tax=Geoglobus ahangari TaxID=113653 RepID=A0A0F7ID36_9EURY|nr:hypothetical protein [Geoglobus ahangari]AKG91214.1 hypothetical protein GAH_01495 [Geoglobus ahangari]